MLAGLATRAATRSRSSTPTSSTRRSCWRRCCRCSTQGYDQVVARRTRDRRPGRPHRPVPALLPDDQPARRRRARGRRRRLPGPQPRGGPRAARRWASTNRFSKGLFAWIGFPTAVVDYENVSREAGATKWRMRDLFNYGLDGVVSFNYRPLRLSIWFGVLVTAVAFGYAAVGALGRDRARQQRARLRHHDLRRHRLRWRPADPARRHRRVPRPDLRRDQAPPALPAQGEQRGPRRADHRASSGPTSDAHDHAAR